MSVPLLSGCWDRVEVNDLAIVTAAVIDKKDDNQIELSNQIFIPKTLSSGDGEAGRSRGGKMPSASQTGKNITEALLKLQGKMYGKIFGEQYSVFIFSEKIAKQGIQEHMDFLLWHLESRGRAYLYVSEGEGKGDSSNY